MLSSPHKLRKRDFESVFRRGRTVLWENILLKVDKNELDLSRFGIAVGLKVSKKATERNRLKRQIRRIVQKKLEKIVAGYDIVIIMRKEKEGKEVKISGLEKNIEEILKKANLMN